MDSDAILKLESLCGMPLPNDFRTVMTNYPSSLVEAVRADDGTDAEGLVSETELLANPAEILEINQEVRRQSVLDPEGREFCWPTNFLVIGENGDGDYYCVDLSGQHEGVLQFQHQAVEFETVADSLDEYIEMLIEAFVTRDEADNNYDHEDLDDALDIEEPE